MTLLKPPPLPRGLPKLPHLINSFSFISLYRFFSSMRLHISTYRDIFPNRRAEFAFNSFCYWMIKSPLNHWGNSLVVCRCHVPK